MTEHATLEADRKSMLEVQLHPLVVLNISDHWTRTSVMAEKSQRVIGALLGVQTGRTVEIHTSFELATDQEKGQGVVTLDVKYLEDKKNHYMQVFPTYDLVGWYTTGQSLTDADTSLHKTIMRYNESPLLMVMDTTPPATATSLPVYLYETVVQVKNDTPKYSFCSVAYTIESEESERISIDNVAHGTGSTSIATPIKMYRDALLMLQKRVRVVVAYLKGVKEGKHGLNHSVLREINALCHLLPTQSVPSFQAAYEAEYSDVLLISYLSTLTRATNNLSELVEKHSNAYEKRGSGRRPWY
eukprot:TRINITY_DN1044_c0_g10_i2.p1 TRINITY_DN1044_c0_g10~~TRINITY_DN1044_c0_g10_i2.p1  ORF type:complete len:300 (+),score=67.65 TRINITY_DN1044_c0_g10_i2:76-975(+)